MIREKGGAAVKLSQSNWVGRALATYLPTQVIFILKRTMTKNKMIVNADDEIEDGDADPS